MYFLRGSFSRSEILLISVNSIVIHESKKNNGILSQKDNLISSKKQIRTPPH